MELQQEIKEYEKVLYSYDEMGINEGMVNNAYDLLADNKIEEAKEVLIELSRFCSKIRWRHDENDIYAKEGRY